MLQGLLTALAHGQPDLLLGPERVQELRAAVEQPGSVRGEIYAAMQARVDTGDWRTYSPDPSDGNWNYYRASLAREAAMLYLLSGDSTYAQTAYEQLWDVHNNPDPDGRVPEGGYGLSRAFLTMAFGQVYNWAYEGLSTTQRQYLLGKLNVALDAWESFSHPNLQEPDRASNWVAVCRGAEIMGILGAGQAEQRADRLNEAKLDLVRHLNAAYGAMGLSQEGAGYTGYAASFLYPAIYALRNAGDYSLDRAVNRFSKAEAQLYLESFSGDERGYGSLSGTANRRVGHGVDGNVGNQTDVGWASLVFDLVRPEKRGAYRWWYDRALGVENTRRPTEDRFDAGWGNAVYAMLYYDEATPAVDPDEAGLPTWHFDEEQGRYYFRNRWQDEDDILVGLFGDFTTHSGWNNADAFDLRLIAYDRKYAGGSGKDASNPQERSGLLVDGRAMGSDGHTGEPVYAEGNPLGGGYVIVDGGSKYQSLGLSKARRHLKVDFSQPGAEAVLMTLDELESTQSRSYTWQWNVGGEYGLAETGMSVQALHEGGRPAFLIRGNDDRDGYVKGWVLSHAEAVVTAGDPLKVEVEGTRTRLLVALLVGEGTDPVGSVSGAGAQSILDVAGLRMQWDAESDRLRVSQTGGPVARFSTGNDYGTPGTEVQFDGSNSMDTDGGSVVAWHWDFGDGTTRTTSSPTTTHTYTENGYYRPILTVEDDSGLSHNAVGTVDIFDTISINLGRDAHRLHPNDTGGVLARSGWNQGPASYNLKSNTNGDTLAALQSTVHDVFEQNTLPVTPEEKLMASGITGEVEVSLLPDVFLQSGYEVTVYWANQSGSAAVAEIELQGVGTRYIRDAGDGWTGHHVESTATSAAAAVEGASYVRFSGLTANRFTLHGRSAEGIGGGISAVQVRALGGSGPRPTNVPPVPLPESSRESGAVPLMTVLDGSDSYDPDGQLLSWEWDLGDGTLASGPVVSHQYPSVGTYTVTLTVMDNNGERTSRSLFLNATRPDFADPTVQVNFGPAHVVPPDGFLGDDGSVFGLQEGGWRYGWAEPSVGMMTFDNPGRDDILYESTVPLATFHYTNEWAINLPNAEYDLFLSLGGTERESRNDVRINELSVSDPDPGLPYDYDEFIVPVTVTGGQLLLRPGDAASRTYPNFLMLRPKKPVSPTAAYVSSTLAGVAPLTVSLDGSISVDEEPLASYTWNFGDGTTGSGPTVQHTFAEAGAYRVVLTVLDADGAASSYQKTIYATADGEPVARMDLSTASGRPPLPVELDGSRSFDSDGGSIASWQWDFGDGATASGRQVEHVFAGAGQYTVRLTVTDDSGKTASVERVVYVSDGSEFGYSAVSFLGDGSAQRAVQGTAILADGSVVLAANVGASPVGWSALPVMDDSPAAADSGGALIRLSPDGKTVLSAYRVASEVRDLALDANERILLAAGTDGVLCFRDAETLDWRYDPGDAYFHRVDSGQETGLTVALAPTNTSDPELNPGAGIVHLLDTQGQQLTEFWGLHNTMDVAIDETSGTLVLGGYRIFGNMFNLTGSVDVTDPANWILYPVHVSYLRGYDFSGSLKWENYNWERDTVLLGNGGKANENPAPYFDPAVPEKTLDMLNPRWLNRHNNNMADTRCYRVVMGQDGLLYAAFEAAGGNHIFRYDPKDLSLPGAMADGDMWHSFFNTGASHKAFVARYQPEDGELLLGQEINSVYEDGDGMLQANALRTKAGGLAVDERGRIHLGGSSASGFPMPGAPRWALGPGEVSVNPFSTDLYTGGAYLMVLSPDMETRLYTTRISGGSTHAVAARLLPGNGRASIAFGGTAEPLKYDTPGLVRLQAVNALQEIASGSGHDGFFTVLGGAGGEIPEALLALDRRDGRLPLTVSADASGSTDADGSVVSYEWDFTGEGSFVGGSATASHTFTEAGDYACTVRVTDNDGWYAERAVTVSVYPAEGEGPTAHAGADKDWVAGEGGAAEVILDGSASMDRDGQIVQYRWLRDGAEVGTGRQLTLSMETGPAEFVLEVTDNDGHSASDTVRHAVYPQGTEFVHLIPEADTYVREGLFSSDNYSTSEILAVSGGSLDRKRRAYLRFNLAQLPGEIIDGYLKGETVGTMAYGRTVDLHFIGQDEEVYSFLNAENAPQAGDLLESLTIAPEDKELVSGSLIPLLTEEQLGDGVLSLLLRSDQTDLVEIYSREAWDLNKRVRLRLALRSGDGTRPVAHFSNDPEGGSRPVAIDFDATASVDPNGSIERYEWDFGDGGTAVGPTPQHTFTAAGDWPVQLTVTDASGLRDRFRKTVTVDNGEPTAVAAFSVESGRLVSFDARASSDVGDGALVGYFWQFGDGTTAHGDVVQHEYATAGSWTARLTVTDNEGFSDSHTFTVTVNEGDPVAIIAATPGSGQQPLTVQFDGSASVDYDGVITSFSWDFGDGNTATEATVEHTYTGSGLMVATLTVTDDEGRTGEATMEIPVIPQLRSINLNFGDPEPSIYALDSAEAAGVFEDTGWINFDNRENGEVSYGMTNLPDDQGNPTGVDLVVATDHYIDEKPEESAGTATANERLMAQYLSHWNSPDPVTLTFQNIPEEYQRQGYDVIVYAGRDEKSAEDGILGAHIDGGESRWVMDRNSIWEGVFTESTATTKEALIDGPSYLRFRDLQQESFTLTLHGSQRDQPLDGLGPNAVQIRMSKGMPNPEMTMSQERPLQFERVVFDATASTDNSEVRHYGWDFGDGATGEGAVVEHRYAEPGTYAVTLTVEDDLGNRSELEEIIIIHPADGRRSIGLNFTSVGLEIGGHEWAGPFPRRNWNNVFSDSVSTGTWQDDTGTGTELSLMAENGTIAYTAEGTSLASADHKVNKGSLGHYNQVPRYTLNGLPPWLTDGGWDLAVLFGGSRADAGTIGITLGGIQRFLHTDSSVWSGYYAESQARAASHAVSGRNYVLFRNLGEGPVSFSIDHFDGIRPTITGLQLIARAPSPVIEASVTEGTAPLTVSFDARSSTGEGSLSPEWDFGGEDQRAGWTTQHTFSEPGLHVVYLQVASAHAKAYARQEIRVRDAAVPQPRPQFTIHKSAGEPPVSVFFDASASLAGEDGRFRWDFGDGNQAEGLVVYHTYTDHGMYPVVLTVESSGGTASVTQRVEIPNTLFAAPEARYEVDFISGNAPQTVNFDAGGTTGPNIPMTYHWDFGDGSTGTGEQLSHTYNEPGSYLPVLTVCNEGGCSEFSGEVIEIYPTAPAGDGTVISVNMAGDLPLQANETAGILPRANWNNLTTKEPLTLLDDQGLATGTTVSISDSIDYASGDTDPRTGDEKLMARTEGTYRSEGVTVTVDNIPQEYLTSGYKVVFYWAADSDGSGIGSVSLNDDHGVQQFYLRDSTATWEGSFRKTTATSSSEVAEDTHYAVFENRTASSFTVTLERDAADVNPAGLQIIRNDAQPQPQAPTIATAVEGERIRFGETTIRLDAGESTGSAQDPIAAFRWDMDGDGEVDATGAAVEFHYTVPGIYIIDLEVESSLGAISRWSTEVTVLQEPRLRLNRPDAAQSMVFAFDTQTGVDYWLEASDSLGPEAVWEAIPESLVSGDGVPWELEMDPPAIDRIFYRLRVEPK